MGLRALHVQPDVHMCDWVSPFQSARVADVGVSKEREKETTSAPHYEKREEKRERIFGALGFFFFAYAETRVTATQG